MSSWVILEQEGDQLIDCLFSPDVTTLSVDYAMAARHKDYAIAIIQHLQDNYFLYGADSLSVIEKLRVIINESNE
jgi:hypothetical protein